MVYVEAAVRRLINKRKRFVGSLNLLKLFEF